MGFLETYVEKKSECKMLTRNQPLYKEWDGRRIEQEKSKYNADSVEGGALWNNHCLFRVILHWS